ncbi:cytochrome b561 and DOMON domain-containing protein At3g61750 isoform X2 [Beta vulgaris subsp. vulgaris]|uniref:cytochrome b561 and DOMON domain-containing protein At3g61750 isoform X2 n=1 Tax=Beta vulgaris subsp. vulgaris TaxID=3555 RepID=UPI002036C0C6|nr:cytochrome b561 and DOMON domain-containing protein At3g61750 isoform X2 [Beta vulgaris subsp. vulgaris]
MAKLSSQSSVIIVSYLCVLVVITLVQQSVVIVYAAADVSEANVGVQDGRSQFCSIDLASFLPPPYGNLSYSSCHPVWETFVLRYYQSNDNKVTIVLSALYTAGWVGIGFSKDGLMVGGSAMVGWISKSGHAKIKQYYLKGRKSYEVLPGQGDLNMTDIPPVVVLNGANLYLGFQLQFNAPVVQQPTLLAYGSRLPLNHKLTVHDDKTTVYIDYSTGPAAASDGGGLDKMKRSHGLLGMLGWGLFLPCGAIVARFLKHKEPLWYYLHTVIQFIGFLIIVAGVMVGQTLYDRIHPDIAAHRGIGYFALTLSIMQVLAFFIRPGKESKMRRLWAAYHRWFGVITLFFGALNIVLGIQVGGAGSDWKIGYGFLLGFIIVTVIVLQALSMLRRSEKPPQPPAYQMS